MPPVESPGELTALALRYAAGDLPSQAQLEFERRLAVEPSAREALGEAVRLSAAVTGAPKPNKGIVGAVRDRLIPTAWGRLFPVRYSRGHPVLWLGGGAVAAALALVAWDRQTSTVTITPLWNEARNQPRVNTVESTVGETSLPVADMEPDATAPQPMPQPRVEMPPEPTEPKKG